MPKTSVFLLTCPYPIASDVYEGCTHGCKYCFANGRMAKSKRGDFQSVKSADTLKQIEDYVNGKRTKRESWCDWDAPIRFGVNSDPFQPCEVREGRMLAVLKLMARKGYPFIVTTKGASVIARPEYLSVLKDCNVCVNLSMSSPLMDSMEPGAPPFSVRLSALEALSRTVPRVIARCQPFFVEHTAAICSNIRAIAEAGAYALFAEPSYPSKTQISKLQVKDGRLWKYTWEDVRDSFAAFRNLSHKHGMKFVESSIYEVSDEPVLCCTCGKMDGFTPNRCNITFYHLARNEYGATPRQTEIGTGDVFNIVSGDRANLPRRGGCSFVHLMEIYAKSPVYASAFVSTPNKSRDNGRKAGD
mgnify:CR=1 FL=1